MITSWTWAVHPQDTIATGERDNNIKNKKINIAKHEWTKNPRKPK